MGKKYDLPAMPFYWGDWFKCPEVRALTPGARCLWFEMLGLMWESTERGYLTLNGQPMPEEALARTLGFAADLLPGLLQQLLRFGVCSVREDGAFYNRRMVRDAEISSKRALAGKNGGFATAKSQQTVQQTLSKVAAKVQQNTEDEDENENEAVSASLQDKRGVGGKGIAAVRSLDGFLQFWEAYPKKQGRDAAERAWAVLMPSEALLGDMLRALKWQVRQESWTKDGGQFIPSPAKYLEGKRWTDERVGVAAAMSQKPISTYTPPDPDEELCGDEEYTALGAIFKGVVKSV